LLEGLVIFDGCPSYLATYSRVHFPHSDIPYLAYFVAFIFMVSILRNQVYFFIWRFARRNLQNVLIIGAGEMGKTLAQKLR
jgi:FlaA1/EpsC-like NDP-sugar epimerase